MSKRNEDFQVPEWIWVVGACFGTAFGLFNAGSRDGFFEQAVYVVAAAGFGLMIAALLGYLLCLIFPRFRKK